MEQLVRVKETYPDGTAQVVHIRESACSGDCHKCSGCGAAKEAVIFTADNPIGARRGDLVKVESATGPVLKAATVLYMLPLALFFGGYAIGAALQISGALCGCIAFVLSVVLIVVYDRKVLKKADLGYTITAYAGDSLIEAKKREGHTHG